MLLRRSAVWGYVIAVVGTGVMMAVRSVTRGSPEILLASLVFLFTVLLAGIFGGWKPSLAATVLSVAASIFFFTKPYYKFRVSDQGDLAMLLAYVAGGVAIGFLCEGLRRASRRIE